MIGRTTNLLTLLGISIFILPPAEASNSYFTLMKSGKVALHQKDYKKAEKDFTEALDVAVKDNGKNKEFAETLIELSEVYSSTNQAARAEGDLKKAEAILLRVYGKSSLEYSKALHARAEMYRKEKKFEEAVPIYQKALKIRSSMADGHTDLADTSLGLAKTYLRLDRKKEAEPLLKRAAQIQETAYGKNSLEVVITYLKLAETYADLNKLDLAIQMYRKSIPICELVYGYSSPQVASTNEALATLEFKNGLDGDAAATYRKCLKICESDSKGPNKSTMKKCLAGYAQVLKRLDKKNEAKQIEAKLAKLK